MNSLISRFVKDESGATAIEYGLIAGLIAVALVTALTQASTSLQGIFTTIKEKLDGAAASAG